MFRATNPSPVIPHVVAESSGAAVDSATTLRSAQNDEVVVFRATNPSPVIPRVVAESSGAAVDSATTLRSAQNDEVVVMFRAE